MENEAEFANYMAAQIFRSDLERWIAEPHFEKSVLGCFVRFHGHEASATDKRNEYLMLEVIDCQVRDEHPAYKSNKPAKGGLMDCCRFGSADKTTKYQLQLKRGGTTFWGDLNVISNSVFTIKELEEWIQVTAMPRSGEISPLQACKRHKRALPSKMELEERSEQIEQARNFVFTHSEVKKILEEKRKQGSLKVSNVMQRATLMRERDYYHDLQDTARVAEY